MTNQAKYNQFFKNNSSKDYPTDKAYFEECLKVTQTGSKYEVVKQAYYRWKDRQKIEKIPKKKVPNFEVSETDVFFPSFSEFEDGFSLSIDLVDNLFLSYSRNGKNLNTIEVQNKFNLTAYQFNVVKSRLQLRKNSNIVSEITLERLPKSEHKAYFESKLNDLLEFDGEQLEKTYNSVVTKKYRKELEKIHSDRAREKRIVDALSGFLVKAERKYLKVVPVVKPKISDRVIALGDPHFGADITNKHLNFKYNVDVLKEILQEILIHVNSGKVENNYLTILGDLIETFSGANHEGSWKEIQMWGAECAWYAIDVLGEFISNINNLKLVRGVCGNHDRAAKSKKTENTGEVGLIIYEYLKRQFSKIDFQYDSEFTRFKVGNVGYLSSHGDFGFSKDFASYVLRYGYKECDYHFALAGHLHKFDVLKDTMEGRQIICPALVKPNQYASKILGKASHSGIVVIDHKVGKELPVMNVVNF